MVRGLVYRFCLFFRRLKTQAKYTLLPFEIENTPKHGFISKLLMAQATTGGVAIIFAN